MVINDVINFRCMNILDYSDRIQIDVINLRCMNILDYPNQIQIDVINLI